MAAKANLWWAEAMKESPLFILAFETLTWILEHTRKWPKGQRFVLADAHLTRLLGFKTGCQGAFVVG